MSPRAGHALQVAGSLLVAAVIVAAVVATVTARLGPTSFVKLEAREDRADERADALEERLDAREERIEERSDRSGPG